MKVLILASESNGKAKAYGERRRANGDEVLLAQFDQTRFEPEEVVIPSETPELQEKRAKYQKNGVLVTILGADAPEQTDAAPSEHIDVPDRHVGGTVESGPFLV